MKIGQVLRDGRVEIQFATLHKLHHSDVGKKLGNRAHTVDGPGGRGLFPPRVRHSKALRPYDLLVIDQRHGNRGQLFLGELVLDESLKRARHRCIILARRNIARGGAREGTGDRDEQSRGPVHPPILSHYFLRITSTRAGCRSMRSI